MQEMGVKGCIFEKLSLDNSQLYFEFDTQIQVASIKNMSLIIPLFMYHCSFSHTWCIEALYYMIPIHALSKMYLLSCSVQIRA